MRLTAKQRQTARAILQHKSDSFVALVRVAGLRPHYDFQEADLRGVDFGSDNLAGFDFSGADLTGANLTNANGIENIKSNEFTIWPEGWAPAPIFARLASNAEILLRLAVAEHASTPPEVFANPEFYSSH